MELQYASSASIAASPIVPPSASVSIVSATVQNVGRYMTNWGMKPAPASVLLPVPVGVEYV